MRRTIAVILAVLMVPTFIVSADNDPFNFYIDDEVVIHPDETIQFRIAWQNIVGNERHFAIELNNSDSNLSVDGIPVEWTRVGSGRLGEMNINVTVLPNSNYETISFSLKFTCQEVTNWSYVHEVDVIVSRWSNLNFGSNDGSEFYVLQDVRTTFAVNLSNHGEYEDMAKLRFNTQSTWDYGFEDDTNGDGELHINLAPDEYTFIDFWIKTPPVVNGAPLAGTGPAFTLQAESGVDKRIASWNFSLEMQTFHNMTIDSIEDNLSIEPGDNQRLEITIRNNGNVDTYLDASLQLGEIMEDRIESDNWTVAIFNAFEFRPLQPNESRTLEIGFDAPNINQGEIGIDLIVMPQSFPQRSSSVAIESKINWTRQGELSAIGNTCLSVEWNETCQQFVAIQNTGNFLEEYLLEISDDSGMNFSITSELIVLSKDETSAPIPLNFTTLENAEGLLPSSTSINLKLSDGTIIDSIQFSSRTSPRVNWVWEDSASAVNNNRLEVIVTMRNDGNIADGLVVKMTSSYFTEMSFIPPNNAIFEDGSTNIRSFEIVNIEKGANFTFRAWANIPDDQNSQDNFFLNITAHSRLAEENPFKFSANTTFDAVDSTKDDEVSIANTLGNFISSFFAVTWAWKWIIMATLISGLMINKSLRDRRARLADMELINHQEIKQEQPEDWMAEFANKKQSVPEIAQSPQIPSEVFTGMFKAVGGERKAVAEPVDSRLVGAASTVLDHHDNIATKSKLDELVTDIADGGISAPHSANVALPDNIVPVTDRTVPVNKRDTTAPPMLDLDDLDL